MDIRETECDGEDWIQLAEDKFQWWISGNEFSASINMGAS
jgi:hypothetical protein